MSTYDTLLCQWEAFDVRLREVLAAAERLRHEQERTSTRSAVINLVVIARSPDDERAALALLEHLGPHHPGRTIVITLSPQEEDRLDACVQLHHRDTAERRLWWETLILRVAPAMLEHVDSLVEPLLIHDLHVAVWYPDGARGPVPRAAEQIVIGGAADPSDVSRRAADATTLSRIRPLSDMAWMAVAPVRASFAGLFDPPERRPLIRGARAVVAEGPPWRRALLAGWAVERLQVPLDAVELIAGDQAGVELVLADGRRAAARYVGSRRVVAALGEEEPVAMTADGTTRAALSAALVRIDSDVRYQAAVAQVAALAVGGGHGT